MSDLTTPAVTGLLPQGLTDLRLIYIQHLGGRATKNRNPEIQRILDAQVTPGLHLSFDHQGIRHTTLLSEFGMRRYGLPTDYESLKALFPNAEWRDE